MVTHKLVGVPSQSRDTMPHVLCGFVGKAVKATHSTPHVTCQSCRALLAARTH